MKKLVYSAATIGLLAVMAACSDGYDDGFAKGKTEGYQTGYDTGYDDGHADGDEAGYARAKSYFESAGYNEGLTDGGGVGLTTGYNAGYSVGYNETKPGAYSAGYAVGKVDGKAEGYNVGYNTGYDDGHADGYEARNAPLYNSGYNVGYASGYSAGDHDGYEDGYDRGYLDGDGDGYDHGNLAGYDASYDRGYDRGLVDGYDVGYDDGFEDGAWDGRFAVKAGKTKAQRGFANLISMAHNDIFDYKKIPAPKKTVRGLEVNGKLLLSEISLSKKDVMKTASVVEQYLVVEMAKQVQSKFSLSFPRSLKIAKAANHFRKYSSKKALTAEDTDAYATEMIGSNFAQLDQAYEQAKKGDMSGFESAMERGAKQNNTTTDNVSRIVRTMFL